jgi:hypothetical protein
MKTPVKSSHAKPVLSQTEKNTTLWIGHLATDPKDHLAGQTFTCPSEGLIDNIQVYSSAVQQPGQLELSLHVFDCESKSWGPVIATAKRVVEKRDESQWVRFELDPVSLQKDACYGFRLHAEDAFIGLGEAVSHAKNPFTFGVSWNGHTDKEKGKYFNYFSLAFKVEMCA